MEENEIVGDVIDVVPSDYLQIDYGAGVGVEMGNEIRPSTARYQPQHLLWTFEDNALYTILMVDPDAPSRQNPTSGEWLHWLIINVQGGDLHSGETIMAYAGPTPPKGTGMHRYVFLVFRQRGALSGSRMQIDVKSGRAKFNTKRFIKKYNLGNAIAGNFFHSKS